MSKTKTDKPNYALPGTALSPEEFERMIKNAEKGPFISLEDVKTSVNKWKSRHAK